MYICPARTLFGFHALGSPSFTNDHKKPFHGCKHMWHPRSFCSDQFSEKKYKIYIIVQ